MILVQLFPSFVNCSGPPGLYIDLYIDKPMQTSVFFYLKLTYDAF